MENPAVPAGFFIVVPALQNVHGLRERITATASLSSSRSTLRSTVSRFFR
jgi:hypothetical protein